MTRSRTLWVLALAVGTLALGGADEPLVFATGATPIAPEDYAKLPKEGKFRAWLPKKVDLSNFYPKPGYQGQEPDCVAWATTYAARSFLHGRNLGRQPAAPADQMSPAYVYNRLRPAGSPCQGGLRIVDALMLLQNEGAVSFADYPDDLAACPIPAPAALREKARSFRLGSWRAVAREKPDDWHSPVVLDDIKGALARGEPVVFAMPVPQDWFALKDDTVYRHAEPEQGKYHAMALVGYDEDRQAFRAINSWSERWGDHGYAWIGYDTFRLLTGEAYILEGIDGRAPTPVAAVETPAQTFDRLAATMPCGSVQVSRSASHLAVSGFGGSTQAIAELKQATFVLDPAARWNVTSTTWPQCEATLTLAAPLAQNGATLAVATEAGSSRRGDPIEMKAGERFGLVAAADPLRPYLSVVYLQADGSAVALYQGRPDPDAKGRRTVSLGMSGQVAERFQVAPPYGDEMVIALASAQPLLGPELADHATERQFLTALRARLAGVPAGSVAAAALRIRTRG